MRIVFSAHPADGWWESVLTAADPSRIDPVPINPPSADAADDRPEETDSPRIDPRLVALLYERHADELRLFLIGVLGDVDLATEALQNTFTKAIERGHTAREESLKGWLFQVAFREALLLRRRGRRTARSLRELAGDAGRRSQAGELNPPDAGLSRSEIVADVRRALQELPAEQRQVVEMRIYEEKSFAVIAEEISAPLGTVLTRMRLAMKKLSLRLKRD